ARQPQEGPLEGEGPRCQQPEDAADPLEGAHRASVEWNDRQSFLVHRPPSCARKPLDAKSKREDGPTIRPSEDSTGDEYGARPGKAHACARVEGDVQGRPQ